MVFACLMPFANDVYAWASEPLRQFLPENSQMIATDVTSPFLTPFKLTLFVAILISVPWWLFQLWRFVAPGLYAHEKKLIIPLILISSSLFYAGLAFAFYVVSPLVFGFLTQAGPDEVAVMTDISRYLDFLMKLLLAFGLAFEMPIATFLLIRMQVISIPAMKRARPWVIIGCFVLGMFLTPPDVISQTLLALPMWILFELGLLIAQLTQPNPTEET